MKKLMLLLSSLLVACGGGLDEEESAQAWAATSLALTQGSVAAQSNSGAADTLNVDHTYNCLGGGTAIFGGSFESDPGNADFNYSIVFNGCSSNGVVIDGNLDWSAQVEATQTTSSTTWTYDGNLDYSGEVDGGCEIDMTGSVNTSIDGMSATVGVEYSGTVCGNDAGGSLNQTIGG